MDFKKFQQFIDEQDKVLRSYGVSSERERIYARTIKLGEEFGELCDEVLANARDQRKDKLARKHDLGGEFADVVIVAFLLARSMNIDIPKALEKKIKKIQQKHNKQLQHRS